MSIRAATKRLFERISDDSIDVAADFVVAPESLEQAAEVIGFAAEAGLKVGFWGAGTHRGIGNTVQPDVVLTTSRLARLIDWQPEDMTVVVEAGFRAAELAATLASRNQSAVLPEMPGDATVGGIVACGLSGFRRLRYGPTRDRILEVHLVAGYGQVVRAGSSVVKSSTGYDLPRLAAGSLGSLGLIGRVRLKLWTEPMHSATVWVDDAEEARAAVYRPLAALESDGRGGVYLAGTEAEITAQAESLRGTVESGLQWPEEPAGRIRFLVRVPPRDTRAAVDEVGRLDGVHFVASFGVGEVGAGLEEVEPGKLGALRSWAQRRGGSLVLFRAPPELYSSFGAWGGPPNAIEIQRRVKAAFDPAGVCNPGILPGGV